MNSEIRKTLEAVKNGELSVDDALLAIKKEPFEDIGYAKVNLHRGIRQGAAEVIYGAGKIVEIGTADEIFYDSRHPYTKGLMRALPAASIGKDALYTIPGMPPTLIDPPKGDAFACRNEQALAIDYEEEPPMFWVSDTHFAASWMLDARAQQNISWYQNKPLFPVLVLAAIILGCICADWIMTKDPAYMDLLNCNVHPGKEFLFGTDTMGRDIFSMIWSGGRISLTIGVLSSLIAAAIAIFYGAVSGCAPAWLDELLMRLSEIFLSVPNLLLVILLQAAFGKAGILSLSVVIGVTSWAGMARVVRTEVRQIRNSEYVIAARAMGGGFFYILRRHLTPNFIASILFMAVMNIRSAITAESTLSYMGIGLPLEMISWGSMLSLAEKAMSGGAWWIIVIPGAFLVVTLLCITDIGEALRKAANRKESNL